MIRAIPSSLAAVLLCAGSAYAGVAPSILPGNTVDTEFLGVRYLSFGEGSTSGDIYLGRADLGDEDNREEQYFPAQTDPWPTGQEIPFTLSYDGGALSQTLGGSLEFDATGLDPAGINAILLTVIDRDGTTTELRNLQINGQSAGDFTGGDSFANSQWTVCVGSALEEGFEISGSIYLEGVKTSSNEGAKIEIMSGIDATCVDPDEPSAAPIPAISGPGLLMLLAGLLGIGGFQLRRRR